MGGLWLGDIHSNLADHDRFAVPGDHIVHIGQALAVQCRPVGGGWIKGHPNDIPIRSIVFQSVKHPFEEGVVITIGNMDNHFGVWLNSFDCAVSAVDELGKTGKTIDRYSSAGVSGVDRPKHAVIGFVSHLDPFRVDSRRGKGPQDISRMLAYSLLQLGESIVGPGRWLVLLARIGPGIAVMEID